MLKEFFSQSSHWQSVWTCYNFIINNKTTLYERCLRIVCNSKKSSFPQLLENDGLFSTEKEDLQKKMFKVKTELYSSFIRELSFQRINKYNLIHYAELGRRSIRCAFLVAGSIFQKCPVFFLGSYDLCMLRMVINI